MAKPAKSSGRAGPTCGSKLFVGLMLGLVLGVVASLGVAMWATDLNPFRAAPSRPAPAPTAPAKDDKPPALDFYKALPSNNDTLPPPPTETTLTQPGGPTYYLQAGAFRDAAEADNLKASLALLGVEASIQSGQSGDNLMHRVRIGPLTTMAEVNRTRATLQENQIPTVLVRELPNKEETH